MFLSLNSILQWLLAYKYAIIFPVSVVEGPIITIIAGFLAAHGQLSLFMAYPILVIGDLTGDTLYYYLGFFGRKRFVNRWGHYIGLHPERLGKLEEHFRKHSGKTLFAGKLAHGIGPTALAAAGLIKMPYKKFLWINVLGTIPKSFILLLIGFYFGAAYKELNRYLSYTSFVMIGLAILLIAIYFTITRFANKEY